MPASKFLGRLAGLDMADLVEAIEVWRGAVGERWFDAEAAVTRAIDESGRYAEQEILLGHMAELFRRQPWFKRPQPGTPVQASEPGAQYVATLVMLAVLAGDRLRPSDLELLYAPFAGTIPADELDRE